MCVCAVITGRKGRGDSTTRHFYASYMQGLIIRSKNGVFREIFFDLFAYVKKKLYLCTRFGARDS